MILYADREHLYATVDARWPVFVLKNNSENVDDVDLKNAMLSIQRKLVVCLRQNKTNS